MEWLAPDAVDMSGEPESFVELPEGRRLMVLAQRDGACALLGPDDRCRAYAARPRDCRAFPFDFQPSSDGRQHLALLPLTGCDYAEDGDSHLPTLASEDAERWRELREYQRWVGAWNRQAWHRKRLFKRLGSAAEFLERSFKQLEGGDPSRCSTAPGSPRTSPAAESDG